MAQFESLLPMLRLPMAPDLVLVNALRRAALVFCRESHVWQEALDPQGTQPSVATYDIEAPSDARAEQIVWAKADGVLLDNARERELMAGSAAGGAPRAFSASTSAQTITLYPAPDTAGTLSLYATLVPTTNARGLPDDLMAEYGQGLAALAKADLMGNAPDMPWHNPAEAGIQYRLGHDWIVRAKRKQHSGGGLLRVRPHAFI